MRPTTLLLAALLAASCAPPNSRAVSRFEDGAFARLDEAIGAYAAHSSDPGAARVAEALRAARGDGRLRLFHEDEGESGVVRGTMIAGTVYVHESHALGEAPSDAEPAPILAALSVYYHEGVHLTQSWLDILLDRDAAEEEAYRRTHAFQVWLLGRILSGRRVPDAGLSSVAPRRLLEAYSAVHQAFARPEVSDRCAERLLDRIETEWVDALTDRIACAYRGRIQMAEVDFTPAGEHRAAGLLRLDREWPEEELGDLVLPGRSPPRGELLWRGLLDLHLLPGYSDAARIEEVVLGFYAAIPPGGENAAESWNLGPVGKRYHGIQDRSVEFLLETFGRPGRWRLAFSPLYMLSFASSDLDRFRPTFEEGELAPFRLAALQRRVAERVPADGRTFLYFDRERRQTRLFPLDPILGTPAALAIVHWSGPDRFRPPVDVAGGYALPGWRPHDRYPPGFDESWGRALDLELVWETSSVRYPPHRPMAVVPLDRRTALLVVDPSDFASLEPRYRIAVAYGE